jgi:serine/threonine protein phosphatase PrpC
MGGMSAGAIASDLAVKTVKERFSADRLTSQVTATPETIEQYIREAITAADDAIKEAGQQNSEWEGMGSTIVLAWLIGENVHVGWCGDSRAYRYNSAFGLERLSRDHSYVQELVDSGKLSEALAFDHPDSNIITRSLGDTRQPVKPDVKSFPLCTDDIILLCTDGLCGVLRDSEIETVLAENSDTMENCRKALWTASKKAGWTDNVTVALCRIVSGGRTVKKTPETPEEENSKTVIKTRKPIGIIVAVIVLLLAVAFAVWHYAGKGSLFPLPVFKQGNPASKDSILNLPKDTDGSAVLRVEPQSVESQSDQPQSVEPQNMSEELSENEGEQENSIE